MSIEINTSSSFPLSLANTSSPSNKVSSTDILINDDYQKLKLI